MLNALGRLALPCRGRVGGPVPIDGLADAFLERDCRFIAQNAAGLGDIGLRVAHIPSADVDVFRFDVGADQRPQSWFRETRPPVATLMISPLAPGASQARRTPSTTFAT